MGDKVGYSRVSSNEQHPEVQTLRLTEAGCARVFEDKGTSGKLASRPQWDACLAYLRPGDTLVCVRLDRIGRSVKHLLQISEDLRGRKIDLIVIEQALDTTTAAGRMMFTVLSAVAEFESDLISERTRDGLAATKSRGRSGGRHPKLQPYQVEHARKAIDAGTPTATVARELKCSRQTLYRALERAA